MPIKTIFNHVVNDPYNWLYVEAVDTFIILLYGSVLAYEYLFRKVIKGKTSRILVQTIVDLGLGWGLFTLVYDEVPFDYQLVSIQTFSICLLLGILAIFHWQHKHLVHFFTTKYRNANRRKDRPAHEPKKSPETKTLRQSKTKANSQQNKHD